MPTDHTSVHKKLGRPKSLKLPDYHRLNILLTDAHVEHAKKLGNGSISAGLRLIVESSIDLANQVPESD